MFRVEVVVCIKPEKCCVDEGPFCEQTSSMFGAVVVDGTANFIVPRSCGCAPSHPGSSRPAEHVQLSSTCCRALASAVPPSRRTLQGRERARERNRRRERSAVPRCLAGIHDRTSERGPAPVLTLRNSTVRVPIGTTGEFILPRTGELLRRHRRAWREGSRRRRGRLEAALCSRHASASGVDVEVQRCERADARAAVSLKDHRAVRCSLCPALGGESHVLCPRPRITCVITRRSAVHGDHHSGSR